MDNWQELSEFMAAHEKEIAGAVMENEMLRSAWMSGVMVLPGMLVKALDESTAELSAHFMCMMSLAFFIGQKDSGDRVLDKWLGVAEEGKG